MRIRMCFSFMRASSPLELTSVITSRCPSCGAPLVFQHAAVASAVCVALFAAAARHNTVE